MKTAIGDTTVKSKVRQIEPNHLSRYFIMMITQEIGSYKILTDLYLKYEKK